MGIAAAGVATADWAADEAAADAAVGWAVGLEEAEGSVVAATPVGALAGTAVAWAEAATVAVREARVAARETRGEAPLRL